MNMIPLKFATKVDAPGVDDGDYTQEFLDAGTTLTIRGSLNADAVPVTRAWVEDGVLNVEGTLLWDGGDR